MKSVGAKIRQLAGLQGTQDVNEWENTFIASIVEVTLGGVDTGRLSEKQLAVIERLWRQHFAG